MARERPLKSAARNHASAAGRADRMLAKIDREGVTFEVFGIPIAGLKLGAPKIKPETAFARFATRFLEFLKRLKK